MGVGIITITTAAATNIWWLLSNKHALSHLKHTKPPRGRYYCAVNDDPVAQSFLNLPEATQLLSHLFIKKKPWIDDEQANYDIYSYRNGPFIQPIPNFLQVCFSIS